MGDMNQATVGIAMQSRYPKMISLGFGLETGPGWNTIIDQTTAEIYSAVGERRLKRANVLRFNRALARGLAGDTRGLEYYFTRIYYSRIRPGTEMIERKIVQSLLDAEYEPVPETYVYPHLVQVKEKFGDLRYYVDYLHDDLYPVVNLAERLCKHTCEICGTPGHKRENIGWLRVLCDDHFEIAEKNFRKSQEEMYQAKETA
jgi:hypothetical protein